MKKIAVIIFTVITCIFYVSYENVNVMTISAEEPPTTSATTAETEEDEDGKGSGGFDILGAIIEAFNNFLEN